MRHLLPLQTQKSPFPVARTSSESGIDVTAKHHFEKSFDHSPTSLYHPHHKKFRVCFPPPTFAPVITKQVVAGVSFSPFVLWLDDTKITPIIPFIIRCLPPLHFLSFRAKRRISVAYTWMHPRSFTALRSVLDDNSERGNKTQTKNH